MNMDPHGQAPVFQAGVPLDRARLAVVLLHGRGGSAEDILGLESAFALNDVAYLAPQAAGHTWYPLSFLANREENEPYLSSALRRVSGLVASLEQAGVSPSRIVVAGFSQGACLATEFVANRATPLGALIAFTGGLVGPPGSITEAAALQRGDELAGMPALLMSGDPDPHVPWTRVEESAAVLTARGASVQAMRYPGRPHTISSDEIVRARKLFGSLPR